MDDAVITALAKWPNVPACHGWITLDARGRWRLGQTVTAQEVVRHTGLSAFLGRNYASNERGEWYCQNGPQRAYVTLECTPWVLRIHAARIETHTGAAATRVERVLADEQGRLYLITEHGIGIVDDRDLPALLATLATATGEPCSDAALDELCHGIAGDSIWHSPFGPLRIDGVRSDTLEARFAYVRIPSPEHAA